MGVKYNQRTMKEVIAASKQLQADRVEAHRIKHQHDGFISPFTDKEYKQVVTTMKSATVLKQKNIVTMHYGSIIM